MLCPSLKIIFKESEIVLLSETLDLEQMSFVLLVFGAIIGQAVSLAIARDGASGGVCTVIVKPLSIISPRPVSPDPSSWQRMTETLGFLCVFADKFRWTDGVTRNFYPGDTLPIWYE
ncbi:hypothetical protein HHK36_031558 [Tetracentron sinense]|uniref:Uncharacterized protein n=1 Tax=Tetracentron sinense TaxID=13715 RepID=A0A834YBL3_TETSI|nr:hypothetical protein HHK36_031558 [Tetracentron sinense]